ncbi:glycosyltransferase [Cloacibacterium sp. TD35]|uniref:glycosyltransferase n=1 Tax=Cloacibacterium sp. TD35 TaxID=2976818 RepID=UPI00237D5C84|nr:glycosyltransferase [Cloacibacterium sp. TD35]WDT68438.1 glycosyltransferase [Cloacibacterium sp. TD35]
MSNHTRHKILFISSWFPNQLEPTNGNFVQRHAEAVSLLHDVGVLHAIGDFNQKEKFVFDDQVINGIRTLIVYYKNSKNPLQNFLRRMKAYQLGFKKMQKPDLVHGNVLHNNMFFAVSLKRKYGIPFVISEHWSIFQEQNHAKSSKSARFLAKKIAEKASFILPVTENLISGLRKLGITTPMKVVGNVVDTDLFSPKCKESENFTFLHISNLIALKNPKKIIKAAIDLHQINPHFELQIGGDGDLKPLQEIIHENKAEDYIKTFGMLSLEHVSEKMKTANCFVLFSDYENQPCVILESLASGIPVIATNVGGIPELLSGNRGVLIAKNDTGSLFHAMKNVLDKKVEFETPENARKFVEENYSKQVIAEKFSEIYNQVLS